MTDKWTTRGVCWLSSARYPQPLDPMSEKKWRVMREGLPVDMRVIGFSTSLRPRRFSQHVHFYLLPQPPTAPLRYLVFFIGAPLLALWLMLRHDVRVFVAQSPFEGAAGAVLRRIGRMLGKDTRLIVENHNNFEDDLFMQRSIPLKGLYRALMLAAARFAFRHADALRVISSSTNAQAQRYAHGQPTVRFMTWSDTDVFMATKRGQSLSASQDIVYAGVLIPRKGVHHLLDAFAQVPASAQLYLVGHPENQAYARQLGQQAAALGISERVHFVGGVTQAELAVYLARARAMVLPSLSEGLGRVVVESMLVGTPVVASAVGGIPDMVGDGDNGLLVAPGDVDALAAALTHILSDPDIEAMGERARSFAQQFYSVAAYVDGYRQLFQTC